MSEERADNPKKYDYIIIGAGVSGLLTTLMLSKKGKKCLLIEKSNHLGGVCKAEDVKGYCIDNGPHAITELSGGPLVNLLERYCNYNIKFIPHGNYYMRLKSKFGPHLMPVPNNLTRFARANFLGKKDRLLMVKLMGEALTNNIVSPEKNNMSVYDALVKNKLSNKTMIFADTICYFLSGASMKETSINRVIEGGGFAPSKKINKKHSDKNKIMEKMSSITSLKNFQNLIVNPSEARQGYPVGGLKTIINAICCSFVMNNVDIIKQTEVDKIIVDGNSAVGVSTNKGDFFADKIIYSGFMNKLPEMMEDGILERDYIENLLGLIPCKSYTLWLGMKPCKYFNYTGSEIWFEGEEPFWAMPVSNYDNTLAPKNKMLVGFTTVVKDNVDDTKKRLARTMEYVYPGIAEYVELKYEQVEVPEKAAIRINTVLPKTKSPVENLYLVGTDTERKSMGLTKAAYSVINLEEELFDE
ncbi:MAG: NAD(P)/FAD-dependent oxidoreductase [Candidatus Aenigmarchaeota archaeon]|nr:NAD(P)/FAD-dependent oxidoreductase [Candidatus Aenigmarchaeota archaeon]